MAVFDAVHKTVTIKVVYYGCAMGGKTTNLQTLHRLTDPEGRQGLVSIATTNDRTLFFDLLPMDLGQVAGLSVKVKLYTVPGQLHYELTRRQVLGGADGVVLVADSGPNATENNEWAMKNLRENLTINSLDPDKTPTILQWNKRDLPDALPVAELQSELNTRGLPAFEAVATTGDGVIETFAAVLKGAIAYTYAKAGKPLKDLTQLSQTVDQALQQAQARAAAAETQDEATPTFDKRFDWDGYREEQQADGHDRQVVDQASLLSESVNTNMMLAERLDSLKSLEQLSARREEMMDALSELAPMLADHNERALPKGVTERLLKGAQRKRGSLLLFRPGEKVMDEWETLPGGTDPLNASTSAGVGSVASLLCERALQVTVVEDVVAEVFFGKPTAAAGGIASLLVAPLGCEGVPFGALIVYSDVSDASFDETERKYWTTASVLVGLSLHWHALRRKLSQAIAS